MNVIILPFFLHTKFLGTVGKEQQIIVQLLWDVRIWFKALISGKCYAHIRKMLRSYQENVTLISGKCYDVLRGFVCIFTYSNKAPKNEINMLYCRLSFEFRFTTFSLSSDLAHVLNLISLFQ